MKTTVGTQRNHQKGDRYSGDSGEGGCGFSMAGHSSFSEEVSGRSLLSGRPNTYIFGFE